MEAGDEGVGDLEAGAGRATHRECLGEGDRLVGAVPARVTASLPIRPLSAAVPVRFAVVVPSYTLSCAVSPDTVRLALEIDAVSGAAKPLIW